MTSNRFGNSKKISSSLTLANNHLSDNRVQRNGRFFSSKRVGPRGELLGIAFIGLWTKRKVGFKDSRGSGIFLSAFRAPWCLVDEPH
jgi:hypothetical protein